MMINDNEGPAAEMLASKFSQMLWEEQGWNISFQQHEEKKKKDLRDAHKRLLRCRQD